MVAKIGKNASSVLRDAYLDHEIYLPEKAEKMRAAKI